MKSNNKEDLIHDMNSAFMAVTQTLKMINDQRISSPSTTKKIMPLLCKKMDEINDNWKKLKGSYL